jgi:plastocyanin
MDYIEFHLSKKGFERLVFIGIIVIMAVIAIFAYLKDYGACEKINCNQTIQKTIATKPTINKTTTQATVKEENKFYVDIEKLRFAPKTLIIRNNSQVTFRNKEVSTVHKIYEVKGLFLSPRLLPGDSFNYTFATIGNYTIYSIIGKDKGTVMKIEVIH